VPAAFSGRHLHAPRPSPKMSAMSAILTERNAAPGCRPMPADFDGVVLGAYADQEGGLASLSDEDRRRHLYVLGKSGVGKTTLIHAMIQSDLTRGRGLALIDPMGDLAEQVADGIPLSRENDVIYIDPSDPSYCLGFNPLHGVAIDDRPLVAFQIVSSFAHIWKLSLADTPRLLYILYNSLRLLLDAPASTLLGLQKLLVDVAYRRNLLRTCRDPAVRNYFEQELAELSDRDAALAVSSVQNKVGMLLSGPLRNILGQLRPTIDVRRAMDDGHVIILNLSKGKLGEGATHLLGTSFTMAFAQAAEMRAKLPENDRKDFTLYAEEVQNYCTDSLVNIIAEARKWRLSMVLSHQTLSQLSQVSPLLPRTIIGTVGSIVAFRLGGEDAEVLGVDLKNTEHIYDQSHDRYINRAEPIVLTDTPNFCAWAKLLDRGVPTKTRLIQTYPPKTADTGRFEAVRARSRARHLRPRAVVEDKINRFLSSSAVKQSRKKRGSQNRARLAITWPIKGEIS
jgi:GTPase SAR1 family protein